VKASIAKILYGNCKASGMAPGAYPKILGIRRFKPEEAIACPVCGKSVKLRPHKFPGNARIPHHVGF
jgi:hypothetical protein